MTTLYKLTTTDGKTRPGLHNECVWGEGITHSGTGEGELCGPGWIHAYTDPLLAILLNPIHAAYPNPLLWEAEGEVALDDGLKVGCRSLTTLRRLTPPVITTEQRVLFGILCAKQVNTDTKWDRWAVSWLEGKDRSHGAAYAAARAAASAAASAADVAAYATARAAAYAAASAADAAADAAASAAASAADAAAYAADAAARAAAYAAASAADAAAYAPVPFDLKALAAKAINMK